MSTLEDLDDLEREGKEENKDDRDEDKKRSDQHGDAEMKDADGGKKEEKEDDLIDTEILQSSTRDINMRRRLLDNDMRIMKSEFQRLTHEQGAMKEKIKENLDKIENNRSASSRHLSISMLIAFVKATSLSRWKCGRASGSRCRKRSCRRGSKY